MGLPFFAYLLRCADGSYYAGHTDDLQKRVAQHQYGEIPGYTSTRRPLELVWSCEFNTRYEALEAERKIKGWSRAKKEALIRGDWAAIQRLAGRQKPFETGHQPAASAPPQDEREVYGRDFNETVRAEEGLSKREGPSRSTAHRPKSFETGHQPAASAPPQDEREVCGRDFNETVRAEEGLSEREGPSRSTAHRPKSFETGHQPAASAPPQDEREVYGRDFNETVRAEEGLSKREGPSRSTAAQNPVIVLIRPQLGENIGKAARAMLNFGLTELRMVAPRDGWPNPSAGPAAAGADEVLATARVFDTLAEAVADCTNIYATTVRKRGVTKPVVTPEQAAREIVTMPGRSAFLFGPERSGMETDDVAVARAILTVPINPEFGSLNLAQAVILCAYEWSKTQALAQPTVEELLPPAPQEELDGMIAQLEGMLTPRGYYRGQGRDAATRRTLRNLLTKPGWNHLEVRTFRGVLSTLRRSPDEPQD